MLPTHSFLGWNETSLRNCEVVVEPALEATCPFDFHDFAQDPLLLEVRANGFTWISHSPKVEITYNLSR